jgi:hypothetical protein
MFAIQSGTLYRLEKITCILIQCKFVCIGSQDCAGAGMCTPMASMCKVSAGKVADGTQCNDSPTICAGLAHSSSVSGTAKGGRAKATGRGGQSKER